MAAKLLRFHHDARERVSSGSFGYNAASGEFGDLVSMGIIDPTEVTRLGLQNAASIASLILTTDCIIAEKSKPAQIPASGMADME